MENAFKNISVRTSAGLISLLFLLSVIFPKTAQAQATHEPFLFWRTPPQVTGVATQNGQATVRLSMVVENASPISFSTPICATQIQPTVRHLGCVPSVSFDQGSTFGFNTTRTFTTQGRHIITFSYRDPQGNWHGILNANHRVQNAVFTIRQAVIDP